MEPGEGLYALICHEEPRNFFVEKCKRN